MKKKNVKTSIVTYDTLVGGYSWTRRVERAFELADEMKREGIKSNATVCNPIIDALAEAGRSAHLPSFDEDVRGETGQISKEMRARGCDMDIATTTLSTPFLCKMHRFEEAFADMLGGGIVLRHLTFHRLNDEFRNRE
ncbi:hypothetical protein OIU76_027412 [Salix suchowensis]|nr:hypothetical protein OIU76_027412 [Salix suchowensis]